MTDEDHQILFNILNQGLWDQDVMDAPSDATTQGIHYSAVMGEQLWRLINRNVLQVGRWSIHLLTLSDSLPFQNLNTEHELQALKTEFVEYKIKQEADFKKEIDSLKELIGNLRGDVREIMSMHDG